jgi:beta-N-acetylhexosaminidase
MIDSAKIQRAGALLAVGLRGAVPGDDHLEADLDVCAEAGVGGVILFDVDVAAFRRAVAAGTPADEARWRAERNVRSPGQLKTLVRYLRSRLGDDLVVMIDQEGGAVARLRAERGFAGTLVSAQEFGRLSGPAQQDAARQQAVALADLGIDVNLAPVVDLERRPEARIAVQQRSFGDDVRRITACAQTVIGAHARAGVGSCLKHFPGLGSVVADTHDDVLPVLRDGFDRALELAPYRELIQGPRPPEMVMAAHVIWAEVDATRPVSRSRAALTDVLRAELGFEGVIATDSLDMGAALAGGAGVEEVAIESLAAGADLLLHAVNLSDEAFAHGHPALALATAVAEAVDGGVLDGGWSELEQRTARVRALRHKTKR